MCFLATSVKAVVAEYRSFEVNEFRDFINIMLDIPTDEFLLFRGQCYDKALLPKIARYDLADPEEKEREMLEDFQRRSLHLIDYHPGNSWDWLALAQHHGMATRLLDWTENPLIAMWFGINSKIELPEYEYGVVWGFHVPKKDVVISTQHKDPFEGSRVQVFKPNHITKRISAQFGWFTIHRINSAGKFIPFETHPEYAPKLFKIKINRSCFKECQLRLHNFGINSSAMYPDIDGLAKHVDWLFLER